MHRVNLFIRNILLPGLLVLLLVWLFKPIYMVDGKIEPLRFCICIGFPFGIKRMCIWLVPFNCDIAESCVILFLNVVVGAFIGIFALIYTFIHGICSVIMGR